MNIQDEIVEVLRGYGIEPAAPLESLQANIWSDKKTLVVKIGASNSRSLNLAGIRILRGAGVRCEELLIDDMIDIGDRSAVVVGYIEPERQTLASDAEAVGTLLREVHEAMLAERWGVPLRDGFVYYPDDWLAQNIIISGGKPYLVDLDLWGECAQTPAVEMACENFLRCLPHTEIEEEAFRRGYGIFPGATWNEDGSQASSSD